MGLFNKHKYFSAGSAVPLFEISPEKVNYLSEAVYRSVITGTDMVEELLFAVNQGTPQIDLEGFYSYGKSKNLTPSMVISPYPFSVNHPHDGTGPYRRYDTDITSSFSPYPMVPVRTNQITVPKDAGSVEYINLDKSCEYLGTQIDPLLDGINTNPDADKVDDISLGMSIPLLLDTQVAMQYLYAFFESLQEHSLGDYNRWLPNIQEECSDGRAGPIICTEYDAHKDKVITVLNYLQGELKVSLTWGYIHTKNVAGDIGDIGHMTRHTVIREALEVVGDTAYAGNDISYRPPISYYDNSDLVIRRQITEGIYEELTVKGLTHRTYVHRKTGLSTFTLADLEDPANLENFYIPLDRGILNSLVGVSRVEALELAYRSASLHINTLESKYIKWYKRGFVTFVLQAIVLAVAFVTQNWWLLALMFLAPQLEASGLGWLSTAISVVMAIYSLGTSLVSSLANLAAMTAQELLSYAMSVLSTVSSIAGQAYDIYLGFEMEDLIEGMADWEKESTLLMERLEDAEDLLGGEQHRFNYVGQPYFDPNETPDQFFDRTIHSPNKGPVVFDLMHNYAEIALEIPKFNGTMDMNEHIKLKL